MKPKMDKVKSRSQKRRVGTREPVQSFLIVCEGQQTEKRYFEAFKVPKDVRLITVQGLGRNTSSLVIEAIKLKDKKDYDQVWCVFDVEDYSAQVIHEAIDMAYKNQIHLAISNQAFEIWFLLHYDYYHTPMSRKQYAKILSEKLGFEYQKDSDLYSIMLPYQDTAMRNAVRLLNEFEKFDPARNDPSTTVHRLVQELNRFTPDSRSKP